MQFFRNVATYCVNTSTMTVIVQCTFPHQYLQYISGYFFCHHIFLKEIWPFQTEKLQVFLRLYIRGFKLILLCAPHIPHYLLNWATPVSVGVKKLHNCFFYTIRKYVIYKWLQLHIWACETHLDTQVLSHGSVLHADIPALLPFKDTFYIVYFR